MSKKKDTKIFNSLERTNCPNCGSQATVTRREWVDRQLPLLTQGGLMLIGAILGIASCIAGFMWGVGLG